MFQAVMSRSYYSLLIIYLSKSLREEEDLREVLDTEKAFNPYNSSVMRTMLLSLLYRWLNQTQKAKDQLSCKYHSQTLNTGLSGKPQNPMLFLPYHTNVVLWF